jgi:hypothetical protein
MVSAYFQSYMGLDGTGAIVHHYANGVRSYCKLVTDQNTLQPYMISKYKHASTWR